MTVYLSNNFVLNEVDAGIDTNSPVILWNNLITPSNLTASVAAAASNPVANLANPATDILWVSGSVAAVNLTMTLGGATPFDSVGFARHNFGTAGITVTILVDRGSGYVAEVGPILPANDDPLLFKFSPTSGVGVRATLGIGSVAPRCAVMYVGRSLALQRRIYVDHTPINYGRKVGTTIGRNEGGDYLGTIIRGETRETNIRMQNLTPAWYREMMDPFMKACGSYRYPFFFAWRPQTYPREVGYCWITNDPAPVNQRANGMMQIDLQVQGIA